MTTIVNQGGPGSWTITDDAATAIPAAISALTSTLVALNGFLLTNFSATASATPLTPNAINKVAAGALNDMAPALVSINEAIQGATSQLTQLNTALATLTSHIAQISNNQAMMAVDQIQNNKFQQLATNASLERSGFPPVVVQPSVTLQTIKDTIGNVTTFNAEAKAAGLVTNAITDATSRVSSFLTSYIENSFIGTAAASAWGSVKTWIGFTQPGAVAAQTAIQTKAAARTTLLTEPPVPPVYDY